MAKAYSCLLVGLDVVEIEIETIVGAGFSGLNILGLKSDIARDMRERIRAALESIGIPIPVKRIVVNVCAEENFKLSRTPFQELDFAVAASVIMALYEDQGMQFQNIGKEFFAGELTLTGQIKSPQNLLVYEKIASVYKQAQSCVIALNASQPANIQTIQNPKHNFVTNESKQFEHYGALSDWLRERKQNGVRHGTEEFVEKKFNTKIENVHSQQITETHIQRVAETIQILLKNPKACVALLIAAAGHHHLLLAGEPGIGKSYSISHIQHLLTKPSVSEQIEIKLIHANKYQTSERPLRMPHHSSSFAALIGGQSLKPGEVTLAHNGVLFLDEITEFSRNALEALREPLDSEKVELSKSGGNISYPAKFLLCATTNPCPCGYFLSHTKVCRCLPHISRQYMTKLSGPLLDRFCLQLWLENPNFTSPKSHDVFSKFLMTLENNELYAFAKNFLNVQSQFQNDSNASKPQFENSILQKYFGNQISLRAQNKIQQLAHTFKCVFPMITNENIFFEHILHYRNFSQKIDKDFI